MDFFAKAGLWLTGIIPPTTDYTSADRRRLADGYHDTSWTSAYYAELGTIRVEWHPYTYWIASPHSGRYFNVGSNGLRITWGRRNLDSKCFSPVRIFMFGGSTMLGEGARDDYTIPSWLEKLLDTTPYCADITNFGQDGYVNTQEFLLLQEQLRATDVPDIVIFYDGINDTQAAALEGEAGVTYDEHLRKKEFNLQNLFLPENRSRPYVTAVYSFAMHSSLGLTAKLALKRLCPGVFRLTKGELARKQLSDTSRYTANDRLADAVIRSYLANRELAEALARKFGYHELFYWQPSLFQKPHQTPYERASAEANDLFRPIIEVAYSRMAPIAAVNGIIDISDIFRDKAQPYFVDEVHLTEDGNRVIAERISKDVLQYLTSRLNRKKPLRIPDLRTSNQ